MRVFVVSQLISDAEFFSIEGLISDVSELRMSFLPHRITLAQGACSRPLAVVRLPPLWPFQRQHADSTRLGFAVNATPTQQETFASALKLSRVVGCSGTFAADAAFARQLRRKFL